MKDEAPVVLSPAVQAAKDLITKILADHPHLSPRIGLEFPGGWSFPVAKALQAIVDLEATTGQQVKIAQIKEKFAGLRFYASVVNTEDESATKMTASPLGFTIRPDYAPGTVSSMLQKIIENAELESSRLCQMCGEAGVMRAGGWLFRACDAHSRGVAEFIAPTRSASSEAS